jgi:hypothetical protein
LLVEKLLQSINWLHMSDDRKSRAAHTQPSFVFRRNDKMMQRRSIAALPLSGDEIEKAIGDGRAADHTTVPDMGGVFTGVAATIQTAAINGIRKRGVENVSCVQRVVVEEAVDGAMDIVLA